MHDENHEQHLYIHDACSEQMYVLIVTGYSGAGKNSILRALEDIGFYCIDNLPSGLIDSFFHMMLQANLLNKRIALGIDVRGSSNMQQLIDDLMRIRTTWSYTLKILFVTSSPQVLLKRFQETRRNHPLGNSGDLVDAIQREYELLKPLHDHADIVFNTDHMNVHELRNVIQRSFAVVTDRHLTVSLISFGFKYGVPIESNFVYDVRSLPNPYFVPALKSLKGTDEAVRTYLFKQQSVCEYWDKLRDFVLYAITKSYEEGRFFVVISIGCTGGRHRSVALVHELAQAINTDVTCVVKHRDIEKDHYEPM